MDRDLVVIPPTEPEIPLDALVEQITDETATTR